MVVALLATVSEVEGAPKKAASGAVQKHLGAQKQGRLAWENYKPGLEGGLAGGANRLVAHAVQDVTMLRKYIPKVREFLHWSLRQGATFADARQIDICLADHLTFQCYSMERE